VRLCSPYFFHPYTPAAVLWNCRSLLSAIEFWEIDRKILFYVFLSKIISASGYLPDQGSPVPACSVKVKAVIVFVLNIFLSYCVWADHERAVTGHWLFPFTRPVVFFTIVCIST
jgi:hypothetical protein